MCRKRDGKVTSNHKPVPGPSHHKQAASDPQQVVSRINSAAHSVTGPVSDPVPVQNRGNPGSPLTITSPEGMIDLTGDS